MSPNANPVDVMVDRMVRLTWGLYVDHRRQLAAIPSADRCTVEQSQERERLALLIENLEGDLAHQYRLLSPA